MYKIGGRAPPPPPGGNIVIFAKIQINTVITVIEITVIEISCMTVRGIEEFISIII